MESLECHWPFPPAVPKLGVGEVHIWYVSIVKAFQFLEDLKHFLSKDEQERAKRFYFAKDTNKFIIARGILRYILGVYLGISPKEVKFSYGSYGKPRLALENQEFLKFNLAHSGKGVIYGISYQKEIGVDIEQLREFPHLLQLAQRFFSSKEYEFLIQLPSWERIQAFFSLWTCKEAYLKAKGVGLTFPLDKIEILLSQNTSPSLFCIEGDRKEALQWSVHLLYPVSGYIGAFAAEKSIKEYKSWQWMGLV